MPKPITVLLIAVAFAAGIRGQTAELGVRATHAKGEVLSVGPNEILIGTDRGALSVRVGATTVFKRIPADAPSLRSAVSATVAEIGIADKLLVTGNLFADHRLIMAKTVYVIPQAEIARRKVRESELWARRGISGRVSSVDADANRITVEMRGLGTSSTITIQLRPTTVLKRYSNLSVRYVDARSSRLADIRPGDMLRALGDRSQDGSKFDVEIVVTGAFRTTVGRVVSVDEARGEIIVEDLKTRKYITASFDAEAELRRFPASAAQRLVVPVSELDTSGPKKDFDAIFEQFPTIAVIDLRIGDTVAISSSRHAPPDRISAIKLLVGVEPFLRPFPLTDRHDRRNATAGGWFTLPGFDDPYSP